MNSPTSGFLVLTFISILSGYCFSQEIKQATRLDQQQLKPRSEMRSVQVQKVSNDPEPVEYTHAEEAPVFVSITNPASMNAPVPEPELSKEEKIEKLKKEIDSIEAKIFFLQDDPIENANEIQEKQSLLELKKSELNLLENE